MEGGGKGPGIADQIAKLLGQAPSVPKGDGVPKQGSQSKMPAGLVYDGGLTTGALPLPTTQQAESYDGSVTVGVYNSGSKRPVDAMHQLIASNPALVAALTGLERDANGKITNSSLERIRDALDSQALTPQQIQQKAQQRVESFQQQMAARVASEAKLAPPVATLGSSAASTAAAAQRAVTAAAIRYQGLAAGQLTHHLVAQQGAAAEQAAVRAAAAAAAAAAFMDRQQASPCSRDVGAVGQLAVSSKVDATMSQPGQFTVSAKQTNSSSSNSDPIRLDHPGAESPTVGSATDQQETTSIPRPPAYAGPIICTAAIPVPGRSASPAASSNDGSTPGSNSRMASMRNSLSLSVDVSQHMPSDISSENSGSSSHTSSEHDGAADGGSHRSSSENSQEPAMGMQGSSESLQDSDRSASQLDDEKQHHLELGSTEHLPRPWESGGQGLSGSVESTAAPHNEAAAVEGANRPSSIGSKNGSHHKKPSTPGYALHKKASTFSSSASDDNGDDVSDSERQGAQQQRQLGQRVKQHQVQPQGGIHDEAEQLQQQDHKKQQWGHKLSKRPPTPGVSLGKPVSIFNSESASSSNKGSAGSMRHSSDGDGQAAAAAAEVRKKQTWGHRLSKRPPTPGVSLGRPISIFSSSGQQRQAGSEAVSRAAVGRPKSAPGESKQKARYSDGSDAGTADSEHLVQFAEPGSNHTKQKPAAAVRKRSQAAAEKQQQWGHKLSKRPPTPGAALGQPISIFSDSGSSRGSSRASRNEPEANDESNGADSDGSDEHLVRFQPDPETGKADKQQKPSISSSSMGESRPQSAPGYSRVSAAALLEAAEDSHVHFRDPQPRVVFNPALVQPGKTSDTAPAGASVRKHTEQQWGQKLTKRPPTPAVGLGKPVSIFSESGSNKQQQEQQQPAVAFGSSDAGDSGDLPSTAAPAATAQKQPGSRTAAAQQHHSKQKHQKASKRAPTPGASLGKPVSIFSSEGSGIELQEEPAHDDKHASRFADAEEVTSDADDSAAAPEAVESGLAGPASRKPGPSVSAPQPQQQQHDKQSQKLSKRAPTPGASLGKPVSIFSSEGSIKEREQQGEEGEWGPPSATAGPAEQHYQQHKATPSASSGTAHGVSVTDKPAADSSHQQQPMSSRTGRRVSFSETGAADEIAPYEQKATDSPAAGSSHQQQPRGRRVSFSETGAAGEIVLHEQRATGSPAAGSSHQQQPRGRRVSFSETGGAEGLGTQEHRPGATDSPAEDSSHQQQPRSRRVSFSETNTAEGWGPCEGSSPSAYNSRQQQPQSARTGRRVSFSETGAAEGMGPDERGVQSTSHVSPSAGQRAAPAAASIAQGQQQPQQSGASNSLTPSPLQPASAEQSPSSGRRLSARSISIVVSDEPEQEAAEHDHKQQDDRQHSLAAVSTAAAVRNAANGNSGVAGRSSGVQQALLQHNADLALEQQQQDDRRNSKAATTPGAALGKAGRIFTNGAPPQHPPKSQDPPAAASGGSPVRASSLQQSLCRHRIHLLQHNPDLALERQQQKERMQQKSATTPGAGLGRAANIFKEGSPTQQRQSPQGSPAAAVAARAGSLQQALLQHNPDLALEQQQQQDRKQLRAATTPGAGLGRAASIFKDSSPAQQGQSPHGSPAGVSAARAGSLQQALLQHNPDLALEKQQQQERKQQKAATTPGAGLGRPFNMFRDDSDDEGEQRSTASPAAASGSPISLRSRSSSLKEALLQHNPDLALEKQQQWERKQAKVPTTPGAGLGTAISIFKDATDCPGGEICGQGDQAARRVPAASSPSQGLRGRSNSLQDALLQHNKDLALEQQQQWESQQAKVPTTPGAGLGKPFNMFKDDHEGQHAAAVVASPAAAASLGSGMRSRSSSLPEALLQHNQDLALEQQQQWERKQAKVPTTPGAGLGTPFNMFRDGHDDDVSSSASPVRAPSSEPGHSGHSPAAAVSPAGSRSGSRLGRSASSGSRHSPARTESPDMMAAARHNSVGASAGGLQHAGQHSTSSNQAGNTSGDTGGSHSPGSKPRRSNSPLRTVTTAADAAHDAELEANARRSPLRLSSTTIDPDPARLSPLGRSRSPLQGTNGAVGMGNDTSSRRRKSADSVVQPPVGSTSSSARRGPYHELVVPVAVSISVASPASSTPGRTSPLQRSSAAAVDPSVPAAAGITSPVQHSPSRLYRRSSADEIPSSVTRSPSPLSRNSTRNGVTAAPIAGESAAHSAEVDHTIGGSPLLRHDLAARPSPLRRESSSFSRLARSSWEA